MKFAKNKIALAVLASAVILGGVFLYLEKETCSEQKGVLSPDQAAAKAMAYINQNMVDGEEEASLLKVAEEKGMYMFKIELGGTEYVSYMTKDASYLFPMEPVNMDKEVAQGAEESQDVSKAEVPEVKLFVMSYCPFGLQAEKGFLPVYDLLKDKANMGIYFVDYIMHDKKEIEENLNQYCIQKEEKEKFSDYLSCFTLNDDSQACMAEARVSQALISTCAEATDQAFQITEKYQDKSTWVSGRYPQFPVEGDLNDQYQVGGSPTFVINGKIVQVSRSPQAIKEAVCSAFAEPPQECSQELSSETPQPGFGGGAGGSDSGSCG